MRVIASGRLGRRMPSSPIASQNNTMPTVTSRGDTGAAGIGYERSAARAHAGSIARQSMDFRRFRTVLAIDRRQIKKGGTSRPFFVTIRSWPQVGVALALLQSRDLGDPGRHESGFGNELALLQAAVAQRDLADIELDALRP